MIFERPKNVAFTFYTPLVNQTDRPFFKASPTIVAGDFEISVDGGNFGALTNLPTVVDVDLVEIVLTQSEMNNDVIVIKVVDAAGDEWDPTMFQIFTQPNPNSGIETKVDTVDTGVGLILVDTTAIEVDTISIETKVDTIAADVVNIDGDAMRGTNSAALATALVTHDGKLDDVDAVVDAIKVDTTALIAELATVAGLSFRNINQNSMSFTAGRLTGATFDVYDTAANAITGGAGGKLQTHTIAVTYETNGDLKTFIHTLNGS